MVRQFCVLFSTSPHGPIIFLFFSVLIFILYFFVYSLLVCIFFDLFLYVTLLSIFLCHFHILTGFDTICTLFPILLPLSITSSFHQVHRTHHRHSTTSITATSSSTLYQSHLAGPSFHGSGMSLAVHGRGGVSRPLMRHPKGTQVACTPHIGLPGSDRQRQQQWTVDLN